MGIDACPEQTGNPRIAICVATLRRPKGLAKLLDGLNRQVFTGPAPGIRVIIVENEDHGPAKDVCEAFRPTYCWPIEWHVETRRGIAFARNHAVACAGDATEFVAFIDDDEIPEPNWLDELLHVQRAHQADVVTGPVVRRFAQTPPAWITQSRLFELRRYATGHVMTESMTGNVLVRSDVLRGIPGPFDTRFALTGGEDAHCFRRVHAVGGRIVWADQAIVYETVPSSRATLSWILRHAFGVGNSRSLIERDVHGSWRTSASLLGRACVRVVRGAVLLPACVLLGKAGIARACWNFCCAGGLMAGLLGLRYEPYRTRHGDEHEKRVA